MAVDEMAVDEIETSAPADAPIGELVARLSDDTVRLVRDEIRLARAEMTQKAKAAGVGAGLFGGAGVFAVYGLGVLIAAAVSASRSRWRHGPPLSSWLAPCLSWRALLPDGEEGVRGSRTAVTRRSCAKHQR